MSVFLWLWRVVIILHYSICIVTKRMNRYHRLSKEDKINLYTSRPDLDLKSKANNNSNGSSPRRGHLKEPLLDNRLSSSRRGDTSSSRPVAIRGGEPVSSAFSSPSSPSSKQSSAQSELGDRHRDSSQLSRPSSGTPPSSTPDSKIVIGLDEAILQSHDDDDHDYADGHIRAGGDEEGDEEAQVGRDELSESSKSSSEEISIFQAGEESSSEEDEDESSQSHNVNELAASLG